MIPQDARHVRACMLMSVVDRRRVAIGLENGHVLIYSSMSGNPSEWELELTIDSSYVPRRKTSIRPTDGIPGTPMLTKSIA